MTFDPPSEPDEPIVRACQGLYPPLACKGFLETSRVFQLIFFWCWWWWCALCSSQLLLICFVLLGMMVVALHSLLEKLLYPNARIRKDHLSPPTTADQKQSCFRVIFIDHL